MTTNHYASDKDNPSRLKSIFYRKGEIVTITPPRIILPSLYVPEIKVTSTSEKTLSHYEMIHPENLEHFILTGEIKTQVRKPIDLRA